MFLIFPIVINQVFLLQKLLSSHLKLHDPKTIFVEQCHIMHNGFRLFIALLNKTQ